MASVRKSAGIFCCCIGLAVGAAMAEAGEARVDQASPGLSQPASPSDDRLTVTTPGAAAVVIPPSSTGSGRVTGEVSTFSGNGHAGARASSSGTITGGSFSSGGSAASSSSR